MPPVHPTCLTKFFFFFDKKNDRIHVYLSYDSQFLVLPSYTLYDWRKDMRREERIGDKDGGG
jgi:hypothetical protein